jgi:competence protein ComEA
MFKSLLAGLALFLAAGIASAVDVNRATQAELEALKGVGPAIATKILDERKKGAFKDWTDLIDRVKGVGEGNAAKFSAEGLTVGAAAYKGAAPAMKPAADAKAVDTKADAKADAKADKKPMATKEAKEPAMAATAKDDKPMKAAKEDKANAKDGKTAKEDPASAKGMKDKADDKATVKAKKAVDDPKVEDKPKKS